MKIEHREHERPFDKHTSRAYTLPGPLRKHREFPKTAWPDRDPGVSAVAGVSGPSGPARAHALRPPDLDAYAATGGPVDRNNPLTTFVVAGSRITIVRSVIGLLQCGQAQPSTSNTRFNRGAET